RACPAARPSDRAGPAERAPPTGGAGHGRRDAGGRSGSVAGRAPAHRPSRAPARRGGSRLRHRGDRRARRRAEGPRARTHRLSRDARWRGGVPLLAVRRGPRPVVAPALRGLRRTAPAPRRAPCARAPVSDRVYDAVLFDLFGTLITF